MRSIASRRRSALPPDFIEFVPASSDPTVVADLSARVNWYLNGRKLPVYMKGAAGVGFGPDHAPWMDPSLVRDPGWAETRPPGRGEIVVHRLTPTALFRFIFGSRSATLADPLLHGFDSEMDWFQLAARFGGGKVPDLAESNARILERRRPGATVTVVATGPSVAELDPGSIESGIRITCNSAVRNRELMDLLRPDFIASADPVFHFGPSRYAAAFRRDLIEALEATDAVFVTNSLWSAPLFAEHPELASASAVLESDDSPGFRWIESTVSTVRETSNVLTLMMLPIGFAVGDHIRIAGCDGRNPDEKYFWKHDAKNQYPDELMRTAFAAHPSFFRDRDYADYYDQHCAELEEFLTTAEVAGKSVSSITTSFIPALAQRARTRATGPSSA